MPDEDPHAPSVTRVTARGRRSASSRTAAATRRGGTVDRQGWPGTGHSRGPGGAAGGVLVAEQHAAARRTGAQRAAGTTGANSETTGVPTAAARCAGPVLPTTTASAPAQHGGELGQVGAAAQVGGAGGRRRPGAVSVASPGPPVTTTRWPAVGQRGDDRAARGCGRPGAGRHRRRPGAGRRTGRPGSPAGGSGSGPAHRSRPSSPGGRRVARPRPRGTARRSCRLGHGRAVGHPVPDVQQRARGSPR